MRGDNYVATTLFGLEEVLAGELERLGINEYQSFQRAIKFKASKAQLYKLNLSLRTAIRILLNIRSFKAVNEDNLYDGIYNIDWKEYFHPGKTIAVRTAVNSNYFNNSHYVSLKVKDAIVDRFRDDVGRRPSVDTESADISINVHINGDRVDVSLDSSGDPLFKRGYRTKQYIAPLNEALAAGMILISGWDAKSDFIDPMCGSGTLPIEAALIARDIPPGIFRKSFSFMNWIDYDEELYTRILETLLVSKSFDHKIIGCDISINALELAKDNIGKALLDDFIELERKDFNDLRPQGESGIIIINPPYGERLRDEQIENFYKTIGDNLKKNFAGYTAWILSANMDAMKFIGLKPSFKKDLLNGKLKCKFNKYELFRGKRKDLFQGG